MTIQSADQTNRTMNEDTALQMCLDALRAATFDGQLIAPFTHQLIAGQFSIIFNSFTNKVTISDCGDTLLMVGVVTADGGLGAFSWVQAGWCWRKALKKALS